MGSSAILSVPASVQDRCIVYAPPLLHPGPWHLPHPYDVLPAQLVTVVAISALVSPPRLSLGYAALRTGVTGDRRRRTYSA